MTEKDKETSKAEQLNLLRMAFERDDPFTMTEVKCFINTKTGEVVWAGTDPDWGKPSWAFEANPIYKEVPGTDHEEWHEVFQSFLTLYYIRTYIESIV